jgi:VWFA-related protein
MLNFIHKSTALLLAASIAITPALAQNQSLAKDSSSYTFRVNSDLVLVNVVVRDKSGALVRDLKREDFIIQEDGKAQQIQSFDIENPDAGPSVEQTQATLEGETTAPKIIASRNAPNQVVRDKRLIVLFFDVSAMEPEEVDRCVKSATDFVNKQMTAADLVSVITLGDSMQVLQDFTSDRDQLKKAVAAINGDVSQGFEASDTATENGAQFTADDSEYNIFNSDRRLQAISSLSQSLARFQQKKSVLYFSGGLERTGLENQSQLRAAVNTAVRSNVSLYAVDSRGLQALPPGGDSTRGSLRGVSAYSGASVQGDLDSNFSSQETLATLSTDTGGKAFLDSNNFAPAFTKVQADTSSYYLIGYRSTNKAMDGKFRKITVKLTRKDLKVEYRNGYYGPRDFQHFNKEDREQQLEDEMASELPVTDLPIYLETAYFRTNDDRYYVPISIVVPGSAFSVRQAANQTNDKPTELDILGIAREGTTKFPVANVRDTVKVGVQERKNVQYSTGFVLPPGKYVVKFVVRENRDGRLGTFETNLTVPDLRKIPLKMSSVVLSSQLGPAGKQKQNPLVRSGKEILPNLAHVFGNDQNMTVFFEVYDPAKPKTPTVKDAKAHVLAGLQFFAGKVKVFETPLVEANNINQPDRKATAFQLDVPLASLKPGWYTCQLSVIDDGSGSFAFPRFPIRVDARNKIAAPSKNAEPATSSPAPTGGSD